MRMKKKGITLIELMIAMALSAIVAATIVFIVGTAKRLMTGGVNVLYAIQNNQTILGRIKKELEETNKIYSAEAPYIAIYKNGYSLAPLSSNLESKATSDNPEDLPWQVDDPVNGPFWKGIKDDVVVYYFSKTAQGMGAVYREVRDGYNPSTRLQGPTVISDPNIDVDHLKFTYFNYTMQWPEYLPFRYTDSTVWYNGGAVYTQYAKIPPYTRNVKVVISPGNYPENLWNKLSGTREGPPLEVGTTLTMQSRTVTPAQIWWDDDLPSGASWNDSTDVFTICSVTPCNADSAIAYGWDGGAGKLTWRSIPYEDPWSFSGLKFDSGASPGPRMSYSHTEEYVPDYPDPYRKIHMHYFYNSTAFPSAGAFPDNDNTYIFVHAYVNPSPIDYAKEIMVMFHCNDASHCTGSRNSLSYWNHRAFFTSKELLRFDNANDKDENGNGSTIDDGLIPWGITGINRAYLGEIPQAGTWVVLGIPVKKAGINLNNRQITGMAFVLYGGQVHWDRASYGTWGAWTDTPGDTSADTFNVAIPAGLANNYYQWRTYMKRPDNDETVTPVLKDVTLNYGSDLTFQSAAYPQATIYSASQSWLETTEMDFNRSKDKKSTAVNADGTVTLARPKCYQFQATNRLAYDLNNYPVVVSANTFNEVLEGDMRGDGNDVRVYRKKDFDNKCIVYPNTTATSAVAPCTGTETAFKISGRRFGTGQTNVAFLDNVYKDNPGTPAVNEGQFDYYMCYGDLQDNSGYWVLPANHTLTVQGTALNEPYLPPTKFPATKDPCPALWSTLWNIVTNDFPNVMQMFNDIMALGSCWFAGGVPKYHPVNPVEYSYNFGGVPSSGYTNTYYDTSGATTQYIFTSYGGLTRYDDLTYDVGSTPYRDDIAGLYHFYDEPEDTLGSIRNITGHVLPHGIYDVTTNKYYYILTAGHLGGCSGRPGARLIVQCDAATTATYDNTGGPSACGGAGNVQATLRNQARPGGTPTWWEIISDKPVLGFELYQVNAESSIAGDACYNIPEDDSGTLETENYYRGIIIHPGRYVTKDVYQGRSTAVDSVSASFPANGGNLWAYSLGAQDNPSDPDYYKYFVDDDSVSDGSSTNDLPVLRTPVATKAGRWDEFGGGCSSPETSLSGAVGLPWGTGSTATQLCCLGCKGSGAGWVWMDLGSVKSFDRIEIEWGDSSPQRDQEIWGMPDNAAATACYGTMIDTNSSGDGSFAGCAGAGATLLASNGFIMGGGSNNCTFAYGSGIECGFNERFGSLPYILPIGTGTNSKYDYVAWKSSQNYRYIAIKGRANGLVPILGLGQPGWITSVDFNAVKIWDNTNKSAVGATDPKSYDLKPIGGVAFYDWWQKMLGFIELRVLLRNHGFSYFMNKPVAANTTASAAVRQMRKLEVGCYDYTSIPLVGFFGYSCGKTIDEGIVLGAGGAMYQPPLVTPAKPLGWLNPVTYAFTKYASDTKAGSSPARAIDNDLGTYWESLNNITAATQPRLYMDMGTDRKINMIVVYPEFSSGNGYRYSVSVAKSADCPGGCDLCPAAAWVQVGMKGDMQPSSEGGDIFTFTPPPAPGVRCIMEEFLDGSKGTTSSGAPTWWSGGTAGDVTAKVLEQEAYLAKYEKEGFYNSPSFVGDSHRSWTIPFTKDAYDVRLHFVKFDPHSADDFVTVWDTVTSNALWALSPNPPVTPAQINQTKCSTGVGNAPETDAATGVSDPATQFWTPWLRSCMNAAGTYDPTLCKCYDEAAVNTNASTKIPGQQIKLYWTGPLGYDRSKLGWVIDKYQIWGIINPALIQVDMQSCSGKLKSRKCVSAVTKVAPANLMYQTRLRSVLK